MDKHTGSIEIWLDADRGRDFEPPNNCIRPPHFPPHCGCPAGNHPGTKGQN